ncbi:MAG: hypothetical protein QOI99_1415 [Actinomycetota bacterium]|nr:hypothetical protein [Actinomycetota bacterium]
MATSAAKKAQVSTGMSFDEFDHLSVKAILPRLTALSSAELAALAAHEKAGRNRVTLLQAIRKGQLAREAAASRSTPATHLTMVDEPAEPEVLAAPEPEPEVVSEPKVVSETKSAPKSAPKAKKPRQKRAPKVTAAALPETPEGEVVALDEVEFDTVEPVTLQSERVDFETLDFETGDFETDTPEDAVIPPLPLPAKAKTPRPRAAAKAATWEEEPRPQLPRRIDAMGYDLDPPVIALALDDPAPPANAVRASGPAKVRRKFEGAALVMAAILAILLGLAIGTVLARSGSLAASTPPNVSTATAVAAGG